MKSNLSAHRIEQDLQEINRPARDPRGGITRLSYSREHAEALLYLQRECHALGARCFLDEAGNFAARIEGTEPELPFFCLGSHLDSVKSGGELDGIAGVVIGLEVLRLLRESGTKLHHGVQLLGFVEEEGVLFKRGLLGSRFFCGEMTLEDLRKLSTDSGASWEDMAKDFCASLEPFMDGPFPKDAKNMAFFLEPHIEQGPVLFERGIPLGVVSSITGTSMTNITFYGEANHAGTTPMATRKDPLRGLVHVGHFLEKRVERVHSSAVGTIGHITLEPNVANVIASRVSFTVDLRCVDKEELLEMLQELETCCYEGAAKFRLKVELFPGHRVMPLEMDASLQKDLLAEAASQGVRATSLPSGAGHDALSMGRLGRTGMLFIPSREGKSHCPEESSDYSHMGNAARIVWGMLQRQEEDLQKGT
jgi:allantoate deiminase